MIIIKLIGGLGNQMFQFAATRTLARKLNADLKLDISNFNSEGVTRRTYELGVFALPQNFATKSEIKSLKFIPPNWMTNYPRVTRIIEKSLGKSHIIETESKDAIFRAPDNSYLEGVFASENYFINNLSDILHNFKFVGALSGRNRDLANMMMKNNSVSLHVRRGDYVKNLKVKKIYSECSISYYKNAINYLVANGIKSPKYFVFSDDPEWVVKNFKFIKSPVFVTNNTGPSAYLDLRLMSLCKHNIIANSTFSWWGAYLNGNKKKLVISPKKWFVSDEKNTDDLVPKSWLKIANE